MLKSHNNHPDYILLGVSAALIMLGILILASVSASLSLEKFGNTYYFLNHQLLFGLIPGLILAFLAFRVRLNSLKKWAPLMILINLILLFLVFLPKIGLTLGNATSWINLGLFSVQPSEFLKLTFVLYLAALLTSRTENKNTAKFSQTFVAFLITIVIISLLLILQPDIGTLGIIFLIAALMYFLGNFPLWHSIFLISVGAFGLLLLVKNTSYRLNRFLVFLNPEIEPMGIGYQLKQALIAIGSGGIFGVGLGMSSQRFGFLPESMSDSIFAIFAEEAGFIGSFVLISLFVVFLWRGFKIGKIIQDRFSQLTALGITSWLCLQAVVNIGSIIGILPLTGIPLPFISYGGSALISELIGVGILLNISKQI